MNLILKGKKRILIFYVFDHAMYHRINMEKLLRILVERQTEEIYMLNGLIDVNHVALIGIFWDETMT